MLNFPPLMGSELLMVACGVVWGGWGGLVVAVGTILGEMANFTYVHNIQLYTMCGADNQSMEYVLRLTGGQVLAQVAQLCLPSARH